MTTHNRKNDPLRRGAAILACASTLAAGFALPSVAMAAPDTPSTVQYSPTGVQRLKEAIDRADPLRRIQTDSDGTAYTADSYRDFDAAYQAAVAPDASASEETADKAARTLETMTERLTVASWRVDGILLETHDGTLTAKDPLALDARPDSLKASGSDGSTVDLQLTGATETHPLLGVTAGAGTLSRQAEGTRPPIRLDATWSVGREARADGNPFTLTGSVWEANVSMSLDGENRPASNTISVADASIPVTWSDPVSGDDGTVSVHGDAAGVIDGQAWHASVTASRVVDRTGLDRAVTQARDLLADPMHDWTGESRTRVEQAIDEALRLPATATDTQLTQAAAAVNDAAGKLTQITWSVTVNGRKLVFDHDRGGNYTLDAKDLTDEPAAMISASSNDPTLKPVTLKREGRASHDATGAFGVDTVTGSYTYHATSGGRNLDMSLAFRRTDGTEILLPGGVHAQADTDGTWTATVATTLDTDGKPAIDALDLAGQKETVDWSKPTGANKGELTRTAIVQGTLKATGQHFRFTLTARAHVDKTQLATLADSQAKALEPGAHHWHAKQAERFVDALDHARLVLADDTASQHQVDDAYRALQAASLTETVWSSDGTVFDWKQSDDSYEAAGGRPLDHEPAASVTARSDDPDLQPVTLKRADDGVKSAIASNRTLGVVNLQGTAAWTGLTVNGKRPITLTQGYAYDAGKPISVTVDGHSLEWSADDTGVTAHATTSLDAANQPTLDTISVAGRTVTVDWARDVKTTTGDATTTYTRLGHAEGTISVAGVGQHWSLDLTASRTEGKVAGLTLIGRTADGSTSSMNVDGFDPATTEYTVSLPAERVNESYTLGWKSAAGDDHPAALGKPIPPALGANATRILKVTLNGTTYTVHVEFAKAKPAPDDPAARLTGIYVNLDGRHEKGTLIEGWDPDTLSYTITRPADSQGVYILPEAPDGVTVRAGDVKYTGWASEQSWSVRARNGQSRVYTVRVVRQHEPTADERFAPDEPRDLKGTTPAPSDSTTTLARVGWTDGDGAFHRAASDGFTIREGGRFAYEAYAGQTVAVSTERLAGMTWRFAFDVLAPDGQTYARHTYTATYLTRATHTARLDMILIDNQRLAGFDPDATEYTVKVANLDHWVAGAEFDKTTGMAVTIRKTRDTASLTAISADNLVRRTYTVHAVQRPGSDTGAKDGRPSGEDGAVLGSTLASTGVEPTGMLAALTGLITAGLTGLFLSRRRTE